MSLTINNNMMASNTARSLNGVYGRLSTSIQRLSSGLRVNSAADDAAGLAIREMMRTDISATQQGIRNAADAISMIQTADGALGVIDEKLTRMKELAEQSATGTYSTVQRDIINSEYQAMAAEIDRIASATNFNGIKLLDGSVSNQHDGRGIKIHFGTSNNAAEDYYFVNIGDARATSSTGLRVGGDAKNDIWAQGAAASNALGGPGCCTAGFETLNGAAGFNSGETFSYGYNWDWMEDEDTKLLSGKYLAGRYTVGSSDSLQDLVNKVNLGTQSRVGIKVDSANLLANVEGDTGTVAVCIGNEAYYFGDKLTVEGQEITNYRTTYHAKALYAENANGSFVTMSAAAARALGMSSAAGTATATIDGQFNATAGAAALNAAIANNAHYTVEAGAALNSAAINATMAANGIGSTTKIAQEVSILVNDVISLWNNPTLGGSARAMSLSRVDPSLFTGTSEEKLAITIKGWVKLTLANPAPAYAALGKYSDIQTGVYADTAGNWTSSQTLKAAMDAGTIGNGKFTEIEVGLSADDFGAYASARAGVSGVPSQSVADLARNLTAKLLDKIDDYATASVGYTADRYADGDVTAVSEASLTEGANSKTTAHTVKIGGIVDSTKQKIQVAARNDGNDKFTAEALAKAINENEKSEFWAMTETAADGSDMVYVFSKEGGDNNDIRACEVAGRDAKSRAALDAFSFEHLESGQWNESGATMSLGGEKWATMSPRQTKVNKGSEVWNLTLSGRDVGKNRDLWIANTGEVITPGLDRGTINGLDRNAFLEIQNASDTAWKGAEVRTQSSAQEALDAMSEAITRKDKIRADLGALQNRLENTMTNLEIQAESLQAAESRISDVDVAREMTEFTKNNVLTQAVVAMLSQANSMSQLALSLIG